MDSVTNKKAAFAYASITSQLANWEEDDDDDDVNMNLVSKRQSGAFSPMAQSSRSPAAPKISASASTMETPMTAKKSPFPSFGTGGSRFGTMKASPVATPAGTSHDHAQTPISASQSASASTRRDFGGDDEHDQDRTTSRSNFVNLASLDADYRPYHDALLALLSSSSSPSSSSSSSLNQYVERIMASAYTRSSLLGDTLHETSTGTGAGSKDVAGNTSTGSNKASMENTKQQLEHEGHFWSLISKLMNRSDAIGNDLLLYQNPPTSSIQREVQSFISNMVATHGHLDPAALAYLLQEALEGDYEENERMNMAVPTILRRRQVVLDWIQSCHNRSVSALDLDGDLNGYGSGSKEHIMWKDTTEKLNQHQHSFLNNDPSGQNGNNKLQVIHPDAPYCMNGSGSGSGVGSAALFGNDGDREVNLLHKCLLLMKAGRTSDAFELCERMGQPWRIALWDGDAPHGYIHVENTNMDMDVDVNEQKEDTALTRVGNPQRALWKRTMWEVSASLHSKASITEGDGSVAYEAAIAAILADDTKTASNNPLLAKNWMDLVWVFYRGHQKRFMEMTYNAHNNLRRTGINVEKYPLEGTEFKQEEEAQLACTAEMSRLEESSFLSRLSQQSASQSSSTGQGDLKKGISAFLTGIQDAQRYLIGTIDTLISVSESNGMVKMRQEEYNPMLRFILHLVLFFESFCGDGTSSTAAFYSNVIEPRRSPLVLCYLQQLMEQKPLWEFTPLYASMLPQDELISVCSDFWTSSVFEEKDRRMLLRHAREYFDNGLDLVILRRVVRMSFQSVPEDQIDLNVASRLDTEKASTGGKYIFDPELESMISPNDVRKMHSIRWLSFHNEHYGDALVCANMLMRNLLLEMPPSLGESDEDVSDDWVDNVKLYTAKVLQSRFLPSDVAQVVVQSIKDGVDESEFTLDVEDVQDHLTEFDALSQFFGAHDAYQSWKEFVSETSPSVPFVRDTRFGENSVESEVAMNMEATKYIKKKKDIAQRLIKRAEAAKESLMEVLEYDNGWLYLDDEFTVDTDSADEASQRRKEMHDLRCKILPAAVSLAFSICHTTASWMDEFMIDIIDSFGDRSVEIFARITSKTMYDTDNVPNPFQASTWHRMSLLLANTVASRETKISESMTKNELSVFMNCMVETNISLLLHQEENLK